MMEQKMKNLDQMRMEKVNNQKNGSERLKLSTEKLLYKLE